MFIYSPQREETSKTGCQNLPGNKNISGYSFIFRVFKIRREALLKIKDGSETMLGTPAHEQDIKTSLHLET